MVLCHSEGEGKVEGVKNSDNSNPKGCFMSLALMASRTTQVNTVDSWFIPNL